MSMQSIAASHLRRYQCTRIRYISISTAMTKAKKRRRGSAERKGPALKPKGDPFMKRFCKLAQNVNTPSASRALHVLLPPVSPPKQHLATSHTSCYTLLFTLILQRSSLITHCAFDPHDALNERRVVLSRWGGASCICPCQLPRVYDHSCDLKAQSACLMWRCGLECEQRRGFPRCMSACIHFSSQT